MLAAGFSFAALQAQSIDQGRRQTRNEQNEDAGATFNALITKKPKNGEPYYWAGVNLLETGDTAAAQAMFSQGLTMAPKYVLNNVGLGHLALRGGKTAEAENYFNLAIKGGKKLKPVVNREIGRAYLMVPYGSAAVLKANAEKAVEYLKNASESDFEAQLLMGDAYVITTPEDASKAVEQYTLASYLNASDPRAKLRMARVYQRVGNYDVSLNQVNDALSIDRDFAPAYRQKADVFNLQKQRDSAVAYYKEYLKRNSNMSARRKYAEALYLAKDYDLAIIEAVKILEDQHSAGQKPFYNLYGVIAYAYADKNDTAMAVNKAGLEYFEKYEKMYVGSQNRQLSLSEKYVKANLLSRTGNTDAAFSLHRDVLRDTARCPEPWYGLVHDFYYGKKMYDRAVQVMELKKLKVGALGVRDLFFFAEGQYKLAKYPEALGIYRELIRRDTNYIQGYYKVAQTEWVMDTFDINGNVSPAFLTWLNRLTPDQQAKYKGTMYDAYDKLQKIERRRKDYEKCSFYLGKMLEIYPEDEYAKANKERVDEYLKKLAGQKKKQPAPKK